MHLVTIATCTLKAGVELLPPSWRLAFPVFYVGSLEQNPEISPVVEYIIPQ